MTITVTLNDVTNTTSTASAAIINANMATIKAALLQALSKRVV